MKAAFSIKTIMPGREDSNLLRISQGKLAKRELGKKASKETSCQVVEGLNADGLNKGSWVVHKDQQCGEKPVKCCCL